MSILDMSKKFHVGVEYFDGKVSYLTNCDTLEEAQQHVDELESVGAADGDEVKAIRIWKNKE